MTLSRSRGRPRTFDKSEAMRTILQVFWQKGFTATSLDDVSAATGLTRPSLYAAFGNKEAMYLQALDAFAVKMADAVGPALRTADEPKTALLQFYQASLGVYFQANGQALGCLVYTTAISETATHPEIKNSLNRFLKRLDTALYRYFRSLSPPVNEAKAMELAQLSSSVLIGLSVRARAGAPRDELDRLAAFSADTIAHSASATDIIKTQD